MASRVSPPARHRRHGLRDVGVGGGAATAYSGPLAQAKQKLDQLAYDVSNAYNSVHRQGVGLDGASGLDFFEAPAGVADAARNMRLSSSISSDPRSLAAGLQADSPSDNRNALALTRVSNDKVLTGGQSINDANRRPGWLRGAVCSVGHHQTKTSQTAL